MLELRKFFDSIIERDGGDAEAVLTIFIKPDGHAASVSVAGVDKLMIGRNAITLTAAIKDTLATKLLTASKILEMMEEKGQVHIDRRDCQVVNVDVEKKPETDEATAKNEDKGDADEACFDEVRDFLTGLAGFILEHL